SISQTLSCEHAFKYAADSLVLSEHVADLSCPCSDVSGRHVCVCSNVFAQLCHEALTECHDLSVGFSFWIKVRSAFSSADWKTCQGVFENLLKSKEFNNA